MDTEKTAQPFDPASFEHVPVLLNECLDGLKIDPAGTYLDGTAGGAGHSRQIALRLNGEQGGRLISLDQDPDAVQTARARLAGLPATVVQINFRYAGQALEQLGIETINGALLDLGVSSHQLDDAARGFSYRADAPLDMRMSQEGETAADLVNSESREELARILRDYGEEPFAWQIAGRIVEARETAPIETTLQLADIVASAMPPAERRKNKNPSRRTFQALRIAVNHELDALEEGLDTIFAHLAPGGRLCVITFHSLEDRLVKNKFRRWSTACTCPPEFPVCVCGGKAKAKLITRKPIEANTQELEENRRSRGPPAGFGKDLRAAKPRRCEEEITMGQAAYDMTEVRRRRAPQAQPKVPLRVEKGGKKRLNPVRAAMQHALQLVGAALLVGFAVSLLWSEAQLVELNSQIQSAKAELVSEQSQYTYYNSALNSRTNITSVEETATRLGLMKIDQSQITYIRLDEGSVLVRKASAVRQWSDLLHDGAMTILASVRTAK